MATIKRRTKAFEAALAAAKLGTVVCFDEATYFRGRVAALMDGEGLRKYLGFYPHSYLYTLDGGKVGLHIHGNLWYEWPLEAPAPAPVECKCGFCNPPDFAPGEY